MGWREDVSPPIAQWTDISIYELHIRDFSATDEMVPEPLKGEILCCGAGRPDRPPHFVIDLIDFEL